MSHQPFDTWVFEPGSLSPDDRRALQAHLETCAQCQRLERKWRAVHHELRAHPMASPAPGFTQRWQASLAERRARDQRRQAWKIFGILLGAATFILLLLASYEIATTSPAEWLTGAVNFFSNSERMINWTRFAILTWLSTTSLALNIVLWVCLTMTLCVLFLVWTGIIWRTRSAGAINA